MNGQSATSSDQAHAIELDTMPVEGVESSATGTRIRCVELQNSDAHVTVQLCSFGASISRYLVYDPNTEQHDDIVLGFKDTFAMYTSENPNYFGSIVGRVANRIQRGTFHLNDRTYNVEVNNPPNHLHGGTRGFSHKIWTLEKTGVIDNSSTRIPFARFSLESKHGEGGYPGDIKVTATYSLRPSMSQSGSVLRLQMNAQLRESDLATPINMAQHSYFNLAPTSERSDGILGHRLLLQSDYYTPVDHVSIPTRQVVALSDDPTMDFSSKSRLLKDAIREYGRKAMGRPDELVKADLESRTPEAPYGIDHNYIVRHEPCASLSKVATLSYKTRTLTVHSSAPGVQVYSANYLEDNDEEPSQPHKEIYKRWSGICLETQHFPDAITATKDDFTSTEFAQGKCPILTPQNQDYEHIVEYTIEHTNAGISGGSDTEGRNFDSIDSMWAAQNLFQWYRQSLDYYEENCPSTVDGVLGNLGFLSDADIEGSMSFLGELNIYSILKDGVACECGAGIGRVSKGLLLDVCRRCDIIESSSRLLNAAPDYIGNESYRCRYFCSELQNWNPQSDKYALVWIQWTAIYLTDADLVSFLKRCSKSLVTGGVIVLKENACVDEDFVVDVEDASLTRSLPYWRHLIFQAGLRVINESWQDNFPNDIFPVQMLALQPIDDIDKRF
jgi:galactose mutarotase-like enzyme